MMALLGMIDPRNPSQKIDNKKKPKKEYNSRNTKFTKGYDKGKSTDNKANVGNENYKNNGGNYYNNKDWRDRRISSNNPLPKSQAFAIQDRPAKSNQQFKTEAKKTGDRRLCTDYRRLNKKTVRNAYPLPLIQQVFESMKGAVIFSKLDLKSVQSFVNDIFSDEINRFVQVYLDDIIIYSKTLEEHIEHVKIVLQKLIDNRLVANKAKCEFHKLKIAFLGHVVSKDGVETDPEKIKAVAEWPVPTTVKQLKSFIGFCSYYRRFIPNFSDIAKPLFQLYKLKGAIKLKDINLAVFKKLKSLLVSPPVLAYPDHDKNSF